MRPSVRFPLIVAGVAIAVVPLLFLAKMTGAKTTDVSPDLHAACPPQSAQIGEALDQLNFSKSAASTVRSALVLSNQRRQMYLTTSASLEHQIFRLHAGRPGRERIETELARVNALLMDQSSNLAQAQSLVAADDKTVADGAVEIGAAAQALENGDCSMAHRLAAKSGWPKDSPYKDLSLAARLNVEASSQLDSALELLMVAQRSIRLYGGTGSALR